MNFTQTYPQLWRMENLHMQLFTEFDVFNFEMKYSLFLALYFDAK